MFKIKYFKKLLKRDYIQTLIIISSTLFIEIIRISTEIENKILITNTLDYSWSSDLVQRFINGYISGKDFIFTYGILYQIINSGASLFFHIPSYSSLILGNFLSKVILILAISFFSKILINNKRKSTLFTLLIISFTFIYPDSNQGLRIIFPFIFAILYTKYFLYKNKNFLNKLIILSLPGILSLYIFDLLFSCGLFLILFTLYSSFVEKNIKFNFKNFIFGVKNIFLILFLTFIFNFMISRSLITILDSLSAVSEYRYIMNIPISFNYSYLLYIIPFFLLIYLLILIKKRQKNLLVVSFAIMALISIKSSIIRSDEGHIITSVIPSILVFTYLIFYKVKKEKIIVLISFIIILIFNFSFITNISLNRIINLNLLFKQDVNFFQLYKISENYQLKSEVYEISNIIEKERSVLIYPYDNFLLNINNKTYNSYTLQFYYGTGEKNQFHSIEKLKANPPKIIIYMIDKKGAIPLDNIPNISRNSLINKWIIDNYSVKSNNNKYLVLNINNKNKKYENLNCELYDLKYNDKKILFENLIKPSTYYLNSDTYLRLPIFKSSTSFIFENYSNPKEVEKLINSNIPEPGSKILKKKVIKKFFLPFFSTELDNYIRCY